MRRSRAYFETDDSILFVTIGSIVHFIWAGNSQLQNKRFSSGFFASVEGVCVFVCAPQRLSKQLQKEILES